MWYLDVYEIFWLKTNYKHCKLTNAILNYNGYIIVQQIPFLF